MEASWHLQVPSVGTGGRVLDLLTLVVAPLLVWWATRVGRTRGGRRRWLPLAPLAAVVVGCAGCSGP